MEYKSLGNGKYLITARIYRDCRGIALDSSSLDFGVYAGTKGGNGCGAYKLSFRRTAITAIKRTCSTGMKTCDPKNTAGGSEDMEIHTFESNVDFSSSPLSGFVNKSSCCEVTFYAGLASGRSGVITTGSAGNGLFVTCMINICNLQRMKNPANSSPVFALPPINFHCCNATVRENLSAYDSANGDALTYKLTNGITLLPNSSINYTSPFSSRFPLTPYCVPPGTVNCTPNPNLSLARGTFLDSNTGVLVITPTKCDEAGPVVVEITERRRDTSGVWRVVGKTMRDWLFVVKDDCGYNKAPVISCNTALEVCEGDTLYTDIRVSDETFTPYQLIPDTPTLFWIKNLPGAYLTCLNPRDRERTYRLCWPTKAGFGRENKYQTYFRASDQNCPTPRIAEATIMIQVKKRIQLNATFSYDSCNRLNARLATSEFIPDYRYNWRVFDSTHRRLLTSQSNNTGKITFFIPYSGKVYIHSSISNNLLCGEDIADSVVIRPNLWVTLPQDTVLCGAVKQATLFVPCKVENSTGKVRYEWSIPNLIFAGDTLPYLHRTLLLPDIIRVAVTDGTGCTAHAWRNIGVGANPNLNLGNDKEFCPGDTIPVTLYDQKLLTGNRFRYLWSTGETTKVINAKPHSLHWLQVTDTLTGCFSRDTINLFTTKSPGKFLGADRRFCPGHPVTLKPVNLEDQRISRFSWQELNSSQILSNDSMYPFNMKTGTCIVLTENILKNGGGSCNFSDTICMHPFVPLDLKTSDTSFCFSRGMIDLTNLSSKFKSSIYHALFISSEKNPIVQDSNFNSWYKTNLISNNLLLAGDYKDKIIVTVPDTGGLACASTDSFNIIFRHSPEIPLKVLIKSSDTDSIPMDDFLASPLNRTRYHHVWRCIAAPPFADPLKLLHLNNLPNRNYRFIFDKPDAASRVGVYQFELTLRDYVTDCEHIDTTEMQVSYPAGIHTKSAFAGKAWPNPVRPGAVLHFAGASRSGTVSLLNAAGKVIRIKQPDGNFEITIPDGLADGVYYLQMTTAKGSLMLIPFLVRD